jgi:outer membrane protein assembly factor BamB
LKMEGKYMSEVKSRLNARSIALAVAILSSTLGLVPAVQAQDLPADTAATADAWTTFKGNLQRTGASGTPLSLPLNLTWRHTVDLAQYAPPPVNNASPLVVGPPNARRVYFAIGQQVYCVDGQTGASLWAQPRQLDAAVQAPLALLSGGDSGDLILAVLSTGRLTALQANDGTMVWEAATGGSVREAPVVVTTGAGERIIVPVSTGQIRAFTRSGTPDEKWNVTLGRFGAAPMSSPVLSTDGKRMFIAANDQNLYAINLQTGKNDYSVTLPGTPVETPALLGDRLVVAAGESLVALNQRTGSVAWTATANGRPMASPAGRFAAGGQGAVYVGSNKGVLTAVDLKTGKPLWTADLGAQVTGSPLVFPNAILVGTRNGMLYGVKPDNGDIVWRYRLHAERDIALQPRTRATPQGVVVTRAEPDAAIAAITR